MVYAQNSEMLQNIIADNMNPIQPRDFHASLAIEWNTVYKSCNTKDKIMISVVVDVVTDNLMQVNEVSTNTLR